MIKSMSRICGLCSVYCGVCFVRTLYTADGNACTRNSSGDEIANVNFLCDDIVQALKIQ